MAVAASPPKRTTATKSNTPRSDRADREQRDGRRHERTDASRAASRHDHSPRRCVHSATSPAGAACTQETSASCIRESANLMRPGGSTLIGAGRSLERSVSPPVLQRAGDCGDTSKPTAPRAASQDAPSRRGNRCENDRLRIRPCRSREAGWPQTRAQRCDRIQLSTYLRTVQV